MKNKLNRKFWQTAKRCVAGSLLALAPAESLRADGFLLPNQDPEAIGRGNAFAATADDPAAIYYNPAGITQLEGIQASLGIYEISAFTKYSSPAGSAHTDATPQTVPQVFAVDTLTNIPVSFGVGIYAPYGLSINWGDNSPFKTVAESGSLTYLTANPNIAIRLSKELSVAGGITINYAEANFQSALPFGGEFKFHGSDVEPGANFGILFQPQPMWSFGLNYHSETTMNFAGKVQQTFGLPFPSSVYTDAKIRFPQYATGGVSFRPTPNWNLEFDLNWTEWSVLRNITFRQTPFGVPQTVTLNYRDSLIYEFGVTRQLGKGYYASVGYMYSENSSPSGNYNPLIPDSVLHLGNFGIGHKGKRMDWAVAYQFAYNGGRTIAGDSNASADGTYRAFNNAVNASVTVKF